MTRLSDAIATNDQALAEIMDQVSARLHAGEHLQLDDLLTEYPDHAERLTQLWPALRLLANASQSNPTPVTWPQVDGIANEPTSEPLGDFQIIRELGRGGMGVVYEATQLSLNRRVALKVLPFAATMDPKHLQRFRNEAMAAASLRHENIVHVYGVGCERSVHFYAMEMIDGQTLAQIIAALYHQPEHSNATSDYQPANAAAPTAPAGALSTEFSGIKGRELHRLAARLIADAADALEHAHSLGIVHRDIKPGNLMVDAAGKIYVTDFGLARFAPPPSKGGVGEGLGLTMSGDLLGTLRYMSPEQAMARHGLVDHRTDIYSLGATLYELLTGRPAVGGDDKQEILKHIAFDDPTPLRKINKSIPVELETITLKALAKESGDRYATAKELAEDLRRWLEDKAIKAKPPTLLDLAGKWAGRHRTGIATAMAVLMLATVGLATSLALLARKESETRQANTSAQKRLAQLERANNLLGSVFESLDPSAEEKGGQTLREQLKAQLRLAVKEVDGDFVGDDLAVAALQHTLGRCLLAVGESTEAITLLDKAVETRRSQLGSDDSETLGSLSSLATAFREDGRYAEAIQLGKSVSAVQTARLGVDHPDTLLTIRELGTAYHRSGQLDESVRLLEQAAKGMEAKLGAGHAMTLTTFNNLAAAQNDCGRIREALQLSQRVHSIQVATLGEDHPNTLTTLNNIGFALRAMGQIKEAIPLLERIRDVRMDKLGNHHPATLISVNNLADLYQISGRLPEAIRLYEQARDAQAAKLGIDHPDTLHVRHNLVSAYRDAGRVSEAIELFQPLIAAEISRLGIDHPLTLTTQHNLAVAFRLSDNLPEAIRLFEEVRQRRVAKLGADHWDTLKTLNSLAVAYASAGKWPEAIKIFEQARDGQVAKFGTDHPETLFTLNNLAVGYRETGRLPEAIRLFEQVRDVRVVILGPDHQYTVDTLAKLAIALLQAKDFAYAERVLRDVLAVREKAPESWLTNATRIRLGIAILSQKRFDEAERLLVQGLEGLESHAVSILAIDKPQVVELLARVALLYEELGQQDKADQWRKKLAATQVGMPNDKPMP